VGNLIIGDDRRDSAWVGRDVRLADNKMIPKKDRECGGRHERCEVRGAREGHDARISGGGGEL